LQVGNGVTPPKLAIADGSASPGAAGGAVPTAGGPRRPGKGNRARDSIKNEPADPDAPKVKKAKTVLQTSYDGAKPFITSYHRMVTPAKLLYDRILAKDPELDFAQSESVKDRLGDLLKTLDEDLPSNCVQVISGVWAQVKKRIDEADLIAALVKCKELIPDLYAMDTLANEQLDVIAFKKMQREKARAKAKAKAKARA